MKPEDIKKILDSHIAWLHGERGGIRADLSGYLSSADFRSANLSGTDLSGANLSGADLRSANLSGTDLRFADLSGVDFRGADLSGANLSGATLRSADLSGTDLRFTDLSGVDFRSANLSSANLSSANLSGADLSGADLRSAKNYELSAAKLIILPEGDLFGWKKCSNAVIVKLRIPASAKRSNSTGRKCRAEFAEVIDVIGATEGISMFPDSPHISYRVGETVKPDDWDNNRWNECSSGIHFFITREEAEAY